MDADALRAWLAEPRTDLIAAVAEGVRAHVASLRAGGLDFYGYALHPGGYGHGPVETFAAVANAVADVFERMARRDRMGNQLADSLGEPHSAPSGDETGYYRYCVEEWKHWEHFGFPAATAILAGLNERFRSLHPEREDDGAMDEFETAHANALLDALVQGLEAARDAGAFGESVPFLVVWQTPADDIEEIAKESARRLNPPQVAADFMEAFGG